MRVGLVDVDGGRSGFPNLALMKLSAWHKANGDEYIDDMGVIEGILTWLRQKYREQAPKKLGDEFNKAL